MYYVSSKAASELLFKAKGLSNKKELKETLNGKIQAKRGGKGEYKKVHKCRNKVKGTCHYCGKPRHYKANCPELKKVKKGQEEVCLINYVKANEESKIVNSVLMSILITKDLLKAFFEQQSKIMFSMQEIGDFKQMLTDLQVKEVSQHSLFLLINTSNKVTNKTSKLDLCTEVCMAVLQGESE